MAGPYSWVASGGGGGYCIVCVFLFAAVFVFLLVSSFGYLGRVSCGVNSVKFFNSLAQRLVNRAKE